MIIADTGYFFGLVSLSDRHHAACVRAYESLDEPQITTWAVVTEAAYLIGRELGEENKALFVESFASGETPVRAMTLEQVGRAATLMRKYADYPMDLADASLVILAEELGHGRILSTDQRDFGAYRWKNTKPFQNLLLP
jgi:uncharacterized protein